MKLIRKQTETNERRPEYTTPAFVKQGRMASSQETQQDSGRDGRTYHAGHIGSHGVHQQVV